MRIGRIASCEFPPLHENSAIRKTLGTLGMKGQLSLLGDGVLTKAFAALQVVPQAVLRKRLPSLCEHRTPHPSLCTVGHAHRFNFTKTGEVVDARRFQFNARGLHQRFSMQRHLLFAHIEYDAVGRAVNNGGFANWQQ